MEVKQKSVTKGLRCVDQQLLSPSFWFKILLKRMKTSIEMRKRKATRLLIIILSIIRLQIKAEGRHPAEKFAVKWVFDETMICQQPPPPKLRQFFYQKFAVLFVFLTRHLTANKNKLTFLIQSSFKQTLHKVTRRRTKRRRLKMKAGVV